MSYLFQNLNGEAKEAVESLGVTGHGYWTALKTLKRQFGNPSSVASACLKNMLDNSVVTSHDRQALQVKSNPLHRPAQVDPAGKPVDAFIVRLVDGQKKATTTT